MNGCNNMKRSPGYWTYQRQYFPDGNFMMTYVYVEDVMSKDCRYDRREKDQGCEGCKK